MTIELKTNTAVRIPVGPLVDPTDGKTAETGLTVTALSVQIYQTKTDGTAVVRTAFSPTASGGSNDMALVTSSTDGMYDLELTAAQLNFLGNARLTLYDVDGFLVWWVDIQVVSANHFDNKFGSTIQDANMTQILGHLLTQTGTQLADGFETFFDVASPTTHKAITGVNLADDAITAAKIAANAIGASEIADAAIDNATFAADVGSTAYATNVIALAVRKALDEIKLDHIAAVADADDVVDDSIIAKMVSSAATADWSGFVNTTDSLQAIRDRGDSAWITGSGGGITDILNVQLLIPNEIDLANTATVRLSLGLFNALDDLPTTGEITPGTITIDRKAIGGTSWTNVVNAAACSEAAGLVYYDEVFDSGTGYAEGDSIRVTFKSQKITVAANDYEITGTDGWMGQTSIRQTMRGTDSAATAASLATAQTDLDTITGSNGVNIADDAITASKYDESTAFPLTAVNGSTLTEAGGDGDHLTAINLPNQTMDITGNITGNLSGSVGSVTADVTTDSASRTASKADVSGLATTTELNKVPKSDGTSSWNATALAAIQSEANDALVANNLDHLCKTATGSADMTNEVVDNTILSRIISNGDTSGFTPSTDGLQPIRDHIGDGTNLTEAGGDGDHLTAIPDLVWDEVLTAAAHNVATSAGRRLRELSSDILLTGTSTTAGNATTYINFDSDASAVDGTYDPGIVSIVNGTGNGQSRQIFEYDGTLKRAYVNRDWKITPDSTSEYIVIANSGDTHVNEGKAQAGGASTITLNSIASDANDAYKNQVVYILAGTGADQARVTTAYNGTTKVATVSPAWVTQPDDTSIYAMLPQQALTATEVNAEVDTALTDYDPPTKAEMDTAHALLATEAKQDIIDTNVDSIKVVTDALTAAAATKLALSAGVMVAGTVSHDNTAATTTVFYCDDITEATADHFNGRIVMFTSGDLLYQATDITAYELDSGEGKFTVTALTEAPADNVTFIIV